MDEFVSLLPESNLYPIKNSDKQKNQTTTQIHRISPYKTENVELFDQIKQKLKNETIYNDLIKSLYLFNHHILDKSELLSVCKDLLQEHPILYDKFEQMLISKDKKQEANSLDPTSSLFATLNLKLEEEEYIKPQPFTEIDYNIPQKYGPSYKLMPTNWNPPCSGRTQFHQQFLNDNLVSIPTGTEDDAPFKSSRKNQYEEVLFECEDDMFELDLMIQQNASCINFLEPIRAKIAENDSPQISTISLTEKIDVLHQRAIERVYG